jgi:hypothetical protein
MVSSAEEKMASSEVVNPASIVKAAFASVLTRLNEARGSALK